MSSPIHTVPVRLLYAQCSVNSRIYTNALLHTLWESSNVFLHVRLHFMHSVDRTSLDMLEANVARTFLYISMGYCTNPSIYTSVERRGSIYRMSCESNVVERVRPVLHEVKQSSRPPQVQPVTTKLSTWLPFVSVFAHSFMTVQNKLLSVKH